VNVLWQVVFLLLWLFRLALLTRIVIELVRVFARSWRPAGVPAMALEIVFSATDPPVKLLRRIIPTVRLGGVGFDLSVFVLFIVVYILMTVVSGFAFATA
jgi:YggT family protein